MSVETEETIEATTHERERMSVVFCEIFASAIISAQEILFTVLERLLTVHERVESVVVRVAIFPERVEISDVFCDTIPEKEFTAVIIGPSVKVNIIT